MGSNPTYSVYLNNLYGLLDKLDKLSAPQAEDMSSILIQTTVTIVQLVRTSDCDSECREFKSL